MPWVKQVTHPCGLKGRENLPPALSRPSRALSQDVLSTQGIATLSPGLCSAGPLGRMIEPPDEYVFKLPCQSTKPPGFRPPGARLAH